MLCCRDSHLITHPPPVKSPAAAKVCTWPTSNYDTNDDYDFQIGSQMQQPCESCTPVADATKCLKDNGKGLLPDPHCLDCAAKPKVGCSGGYMSQSVLVGG